eukprot:scaffold13114_cov143-Isochrysis_galbana.AAC.2
MTSRVPPGMRLLRPSTSKNNQLWWRSIVAVRHLFRPLVMPPPHVWSVLVAGRRGKLAAMCLSFPLVLVAEGQHTVHYGR